ncbi:hypothetical protein [Mycobacterium palustre]|uniref:hypothetical protein n=1 Tax=Mycobacterium palustre TaxID=153971 RepID=UPI001FE86C14|nr:hypothetical protein [Mycobacterium palustre]
MAATKTDTRKLESALTDSPDPEAGRVDDPTITNADDLPDAEVTNASDDESGIEVGGEQKTEKLGTFGGRPPRRLSISISARNLAHAVLIAALLGAVATFAWLYVDARHKLDDQSRRQSSYAHAEKVALDYAVSAATMNFQDLNGWKAKLVAGTSPELTDKLTKAAGSMEQILIPLQWNSTAQPLVAKVHSHDNGVYVVDCFVSVQTKTAQAPDALQSTATYSLTIDSNKNWQITDVGGIGAVVGQR